MPWLLKNRLTGVRERIEDPDGDLRLLHNTYAQFRFINPVVSGWRQIYTDHLRPLASPGRRLRLLDVGFGGGDLLVSLVRWAARDDLDLAITAIETDDRALAWVRERHAEEPIDFRHQDIVELVDAGEQFDVVVSNHLLHHLTPEEIVVLCDHSQQLAGSLVLHSDIERHDLAWLLFALATRPFFHRSFIVPDGLTSIRRSFTADELRAVVGSEWVVEQHLPFRQVLTHRPQSGVS